MCTASPSLCRITGEPPLVRKLCFCRAWQRTKVTTLSSLPDSRLSCLPASSPPIMPVLLRLLATRRHSACAALQVRLNVSCCDGCRKLEYTFALMHCCKNCRRQNRYTRKCRCESNLGNGMHQVEGSERMVEAVR